MPTFNFTVRSIEALKPEGTRREYWDESSPGFGIRVSPDGRKSWVLLYRFCGRLRRLTLGTYPTLPLVSAMKMAHDAKHAVAHGTDPGDEKQRERNAETFGELVDEYMEFHARAKKRSWREDERILRREFASEWGSRRAKSIVRRDVIAVLDRIVQRGAPILANKALAVLRKTYNFGIQRDIVEFNPCWNVAAPGKAVARDRVLSESEIRSVWASLEKMDLPTASFYRLLFLTAQRSGEVSNAEWSEIDLVVGWWTIPAEKSKNGLPHRVPLSRSALNIFKALRFNSGGALFVFPSSRGDHPTRERKRRLHDLRMVSGVDFRPHDIRRTAASQMTSAGIPRLVVSKILNHTESNVTAIYDRHSYDSEKAVALNRWGQCLNHIVERTVGEELAGKPNTDPEFIGETANTLPK